MEEEPIVTGVKQSLEKLISAYRQLKSARAHEEKLLKQLAEARGKVAEAREVVHAAEIAHEQALRNISNDICTVKASPEEGLHASSGDVLMLSSEITMSGEKHFEASPSPEMSMFADVLEDFEDEIEEKDEKPPLINPMVPLVQQKLSRVRRTSAELRAANALRQRRHRERKRLMMMKQVKRSPQKLS